MTSKSWLRRMRRPRDGAEEHFLYTRVYVRRDGRWLLAANQIARRR